MILKRETILWILQGCDLANGVDGKPSLADEVIQEEEEEEEEFEESERASWETTPNYVSYKKS